MELPEAVRANLGAFGEAGPRWAARFDAVLREALRRWQLELEAPYGHLSFNFVARVRRGNERLVLKLGVPCEELRSEIEALRLFADAGAVRLLDADPELGALLLERIEPGTPLADVEDDDRAMAIAAGLLRALWREPPGGHAFWPVPQWGRAVAELHASDRPTPIGRARIEHAHRLLQQPPDAAARLLHADFHQYNVLQRADGSWAVIDAKGGVGAPGFDLWPLMLNVLECEDPVARLQRRARRLASELAVAGLDARAILEWTTAGATLSLAWTLEDGSPDVEGPRRRMEQAAAALGTLD